MAAVMSPTGAAVKPESDAPVPHGLHSPPDSNMTKPDSDSELSDLEDEDIGDIEPDHYADEGRVPVFKPTMDVFRDFQKYMRKINKYGMQSGIVKVIPPPEWVAALPPLDEQVKTIRVKEPIKQDIMGTGGTYRQANIVHQRSYNLPQWRQLCEQSEHQPPAKRGERRANVEKPRAPTRARAATTTSTEAPGSGKRRGRASKAKQPTVATDVEPVQTEASDIADRLPTPVSPQLDMSTAVIKAESDDEGDTNHKTTPTRVGGGRGGHRGGARMGGGRGAAKSISVSQRRKYNRREATAKVDEEAFKGFNYRLETDEYTQERCDELERAYWKTLTYASPLYGADMPGTLFDSRTTSWNLGRLENLLDVIGTHIPGVNTAYLYLGMWKATFAWHLEDVDLYSINYLHFGAPKQWYSISQRDARRFEAAMRNVWPTDAKACDQFLRHKTFLISPTALWQNYNIKVNKIVSHPGEFVITFPYGYHSGYNLGYNCAEAVNFALDDWLEYGRVAKRCDCSQAQDSVWIDVQEIERKLRGEETDYDLTDDAEDDDGPTDLPTPPESAGDVRPRTSQKKRKRPPIDKSGKNGVKKIKLRIKAPNKEPCALCPNDIPTETLLPTDDGRKAHHMCALYVPETYIDDSRAVDTVLGISQIKKARLDLKCNYCRSKKGACFQCSQKKCTRSYHPTCAAAAGVFVEQGEVPVFGEDGTEYKEWAIEFSCRFHRVKRDKKLDGDALEEYATVRKNARQLKVGDTCQMQFHKGEIFAGVVFENRHSEETIVVDILPRGARIEVEYKWLLVPDPADFHMAKPSANAIPMPKTHRNEPSITTKRLVDNVPRRDDPFIDGYTWREFSCGKDLNNADQKAVDLSKDLQIWYYLGKNSTDAKAQFTEDPSIPRHNPKGHFLDTLPKPAKMYPTPLQRAAATAQSQHQISAPRAPAKHADAPSHSTTKASNKPYEYKPRAGSTHLVNQQAFDAQQAFVQKSASSFSFGTDPRWRGESKADGESGSHGAVPRAIDQPVRKPLSAPTAQYRAASSREEHDWQSQFRSQAGPAAKPKLPVAHNFTTSSQSSPFARYPYLQVEHNRPPESYRSPYRPSGGFMNGYERRSADVPKPVAPLKLDRGSASGALAPSPFANSDAAQHKAPATSMSRLPAPNQTAKQPTWAASSYQPRRSSIDAQRESQHGTPRADLGHMDATTPSGNWHKSQTSPSQHGTAYDALNQSTYTQGTQYRQAAALSAQPFRQPTYSYPLAQTQQTAGLQSPTQAQYGRSLGQPAPQTSQILQKAASSTPATCTMAPPGHTQQAIFTNPSQPIYATGKPHIAQQYQETPLPGHITQQGDSKSRDSLSYGLNLPPKPTPPQHVSARYSMPATNPPAHVQVDRATMPTKDLPAYSYGSYRSEAPQLPSLSNGHQFHRTPDLPEVPTDSTALIQSMMANLRKAADSGLRRC